MDRVTLRLSRHHLASLSQEMDDILSDTTDIAALLVAEQRIRAQIQREFIDKGGVDGTGI